MNVENMMRGMTDRSGLYGLVGIIVLIGVSFWGIGHRPVAVQAVEPVPVVSVSRETVGHPDGTHSHGYDLDTSMQHWEQLTAEVTAYHAKGQAAPSELLERQLAAFRTYQDGMMRKIAELNSEIVVHSYRYATTN